MPSLECPYCGRSLSRPSQPGPVVCDGCEQQFDPGKVRVQPASVPKEAAGWVLLVFGVVMLAPAVIVICLANLHDRDLPMRIFGMLLIPAVLIFTGLALKRGKTVVDDASTDADK
jgi:hypothetical protein